MSDEQADLSEGQRFDIVVDRTVGPTQVVAWRRALTLSYMSAVERRGHACGVRPALKEPGYTRSSLRDGSRVERMTVAMSTSGVNPTRRLQHSGPGFAESFVVHVQQSRLPVQAE